VAAEGATSSRRSFFLRLGALVAAAPICATWSAIAQENFGKFLDRLLVDMLDQDRKLKLLSDFRFEDPDGDVWKTPADWTVDGASIPQVFWSITGGPLDGPYRMASVIHDYYCDTHDATWADTHFVFYRGMRASGVSEAKAKIMYYAVVAYGPRWGTDDRDVEISSKGISDAAAVADVKAFAANPAVAEISIETLVTTAVAKSAGRFVAALRATPADRAGLQGKTGPEDGKRRRARLAAEAEERRREREREKRRASGGGGGSSKAKKDKDKRKKKKRRR